MAEKICPPRPVPQRAISKGQIVMWNAIGARIEDHFLINFLLPKVPSFLKIRQSRITVRRLGQDHGHYRLQTGKEKTQLEEEHPRAHRLPGNTNALIALLHLRATTI